MKDVLLNKLAKRGVDVRFLDYGKQEKIGGDKLKQIVTVKKGVSGDLAKKIVKIVKDSKIKVQAIIQGNTVRVQGTKRDDLQSSIALLKKEGRDGHAARLQQFPRLSVSRASIKKAVPGHIRNGFSLI